MTTTATRPSGTFSEVDIDQLHESKHNPRRHFDERGMDELTASIVEVGVLTPLLVRANGKGYEIAAGHRRYRAAKRAKLAMLPCLIKSLTDAQFMEILTIENLQREDVHPLDEAAGYEALMAPPYKMTVETLATKVGKSVKYIYDRRKLLDLKEPARGLFWGGLITASHAILLARLTTAQQKAAVGTEEQQWADGGLLIPEHHLYSDDEMDNEKAGPYRGMKAVSVAELEHWIDRHVRFDPTNIPTVLYPETAAIVATAKSQHDTMIPITHDYHVQPDAKDANGRRTYGQMSWKRADGEEGSKPCNFAQLGVLVVGEGRGDAFNVCIEKKDCLIHWKTEAKAAAEKTKSPGSPKALTAEAKAAKQREREQARQEAETQRREAWKAVAPKIKTALLERIPKLPATGPGVLADQILASLRRQGYDTTHLPMPRGKTADDFVRCLAGLTLTHTLHGWNSVEHFPAIAKTLGLDLRPIVQTPARRKTAKGAK
jgi:ParB/RepB/Spo0J family partition protein